MKKVLIKTTVLLIAAAGIGALSFKLYHSKNARSAQSRFDGLNELHEVYLGTTQDRCRGTKRVYVVNQSGANALIPNDGTEAVVNVSVDSHKYWKWRCGSTTPAIERSRITECANVTVNRLKVTHKDGLITFKCFNYAPLGL